jgi:hypothetical protein
MPNRQARDGGPLEADLLHVVEQVDRGRTAAVGVHVVDDAAQPFLPSAQL